MVTVPGWLAAALGSAADELAALGPRALCVRVRVGGTAEVTLRASAWLASRSRVKLSTSPGPPLEPSPVHQPVMPPGGTFDGTTRSSRTSTSGRTRKAAPTRPGGVLRGEPAAGIRRGLRAERNRM